MKRSIDPQAMPITACLINLIVAAVLMLVYLGLIVRLATRDVASTIVIAVLFQFMLISTVVNVRKLRRLVAESS